MPDTTLPPDLLPRARQIILPLVGTEAEREALLTEAFYLHDPVLYSIEREGTPRVFAIRCIRKLLDYGCLPEYEHSLARLLLTARYDYGVDKHAEIDALVAITNALCVDDRPPASLPVTASPVTTPPLSIDTPRDERRPTVFISYSHDDEAFAQRLIADLSGAGHACWIDTARIKSGDEWVRSITEGINNSYAFVSVVSQTANESTWVRREFLWAEYKNKPIFPVMAEACELVIYLMERQVVLMHENYAAGLAQLLAGLPRPAAVATETPTEDDDRLAAEILTPPERRPVSRRRLELDYLEQLRASALFDLEKYTPLGGESQFVVKVRRGETVELAFMRPELEHLGRMDDQRAETRRFDNAVDEILRIRRAVLLGEPGAGKTTTFLSLAGTLADAAQDDPKAPLPLFVRLGRWTDAEQSLHDFIAGELGALGPHLQALFDEGRAVPLLDGMNEIPVSQREAKYRQIRAFINAYPDWTAVASCRERDYTIEGLELDRIVVQPLDPVRVREFVTRYLGDETGERLFWKIAGGEDVREVWQVWERAGSSLTLFFSASDIPHDSPNVWGKTSGQQDSVWREKVRGAHNLMQLAHNPYMLSMLTKVYVARGDLPANRGQLFREFVETLLVREKVIKRDSSGQALMTEVAEALLRGLAQVAYEMQSQRAQDDDGSAQTVLPLATMGRFLDEDQLYLAASTSLLDVSEADGRFTHQLLQEYFAAQYMASEIAVGRLKATSIWKPESWWERTNWEEAAILLAGLYSDDCSDVVRWVAAANPEAAAQCAVKSGARVPDETLMALRAAWLPRLTADAEPKARAAVGRALGQLKLSSGELLDNRPGVGVSVREDGLKVPDIDWVEIPDDGEWTYQKDKHPGLPAFRISRYPVTYGQFQVFIDDNEGFYKARWWDGMGIADGHNKAPGDQAYKYCNHPRERVSWYDAIAFCRWLSDKLGYEVTLPTEQQWEKAARGTDGREYPYEGKFDAAKGNTHETGIGQTSAVGIFPSGASPYGVLDMSGNVWEWCLNKSGTPDDVAVDASGARRVLRGGSWVDDDNLARAVYRVNLDPARRHSFYGFRVCVPPSLSEH